MSLSKSMGPKISRKHSPSSSGYYKSDTNKKINRKNSTKIALAVTDWSQILQQITKVTDKVKKLCMSNQTPPNQLNTQFMRSKPIYTNPYTPSMIDSGLFMPSSIDKFEPNLYAINNELLCNTRCHELMDECFKLGKENKKLRKEKETLEKRLYFQSKEKKQLRWKLQKQNFQRERYKTKQSKLKTNSNNNSFTLRRVPSESKDVYQEQPKKRRKQTEFSCAMRQAEFPLHELNNNKLIFKQNTISFIKQDNKTDSLLMDFEVSDDLSKKENKSMKREEEIDEIPTEKTVRSITLEKDFNELLQICKLEKDIKRKKMLRKQMKQIAEQMKELKLEEQ